MSFIDNELVANSDSGLGLQWTLVNTPVTGTEHLFGGAGTYFTSGGTTPATSSFTTPNTLLIPGSISGTESLYHGAITEDGVGNISNTGYYGIVNTYSDYPVTPSFTALHLPIFPGSVNGECTNGTFTDDGNGNIYDGVTLIATVVYLTGVVTDLTSGTDVIARFGYSIYALPSVIATIDYTTGVVTDLTGGTDSISTIEYNYKNIAAGQSNIRLIEGIDYTISGAIITTIISQKSLVADYQI